MLFYRLSLFPFRDEVLARITVGFPQILIRRDKVIVVFRAASQVELMYIVSFSRPETVPRNFSYILSVDLKFGLSAYFLSL